MEDNDSNSHPKRETQIRTQEETDHLLDRMWATDKLKLLILCLIAVVVGGLSFVVLRNSDNVDNLEVTVDRLGTEVDELNVTVDSAKLAAEDAKAESRAARAELREAIALVQSNPGDEGFTERVEEGLRQIAEVEERLERIEALLEGNG